MKKLPIVSIALVVIGLALILYSDPVVNTLTGGQPTSHALGANSTSSGNGENGGPVASGGLPTNCTSSGGAEECTLNGTPGGGVTLLTILGIALCGGGILVSAVESFVTLDPAAKQTVT